MHTFIWVIGCPRSGTTFLTQLIGKKTDLVLDEPPDPMYAISNVEQWVFPDRESVVFKRCENYEVADKILDRFPNSYFLHTIREPRNNVYSIAVPKSESLPLRCFPDVGSALKDRVPNAIKKWRVYTSGCLGVAGIAGERYLAVVYENMLDFYEPIEQLTGVRLEQRSEFHDAGVAEEALSELDPFWVELPGHDRFREEVEELRRSLVAARSR